MEENEIQWPENQFLQARISFAFKNWFPLMTISTGTKTLSTGITVSIREKNISPIPRIKDSFKNTFH